MANLFTYNPHNRSIRRGLPLASGKAHPRNPMQVMQPHLEVGDRFVALNTRWNNPPIQGGMLLRASLEKIEPAEKRPFMVFSRHRDNDAATLIFVETTLPHGFKSRVDVNALNAFTGVRGEGVTVIMGDRVTGSVLVECCDGSTATVYHADGQVDQLSVSNHEVRLNPLSQKQMAQLRVEQFEEQYVQAEDNVPRQHGILNGCLRLVKAVRNRDALQVLVDFLVDKQASMSDGLRTATRFVLLGQNHPTAGTFLDGFENHKVVSITSAEGAAKRAVQQARKRERAQRESQACHARRGKGGGESAQQSGKKGKRK